MCCMAALILLHAQQPSPLIYTCLQCLRKVRTQLTSSELKRSSRAVPTTPTPTPAGSRESSMRAGLRSRRASEAQGPEGAAPAPPPRRVQGTSERLMLQLQGMQPEPGAAADPASSRCACLFHMA